MPKLFDPLDIASNTDVDMISSARKREIHNILKSYVGFFDPFAELIQNAMDAVDERERQLGAVPNGKHIFIDVNLRENTFSITDNGIGLSEDQFKTFLAPNITYKAGGTSRGKKGVGATYLAYGLNYLQLGTKTPTYLQVAEFVDGRRWVDDNEGIVARPFASDSHLLHQPFAAIDRGATFTLRFIGDNIRPKDLSWFAATTAIQWKALLLIKTPLGQILLDHTTRPPIFFDITVTDKNGSVTSLTNESADYVYPHTVIAACAKLDDILADQAARLRRSQDVSKTPDKYRHLNAIYKTWTTPEITTLLKDRQSPHIALASQHKITAYAFFCYSVKIWDHYNDDKLQLRKGSRILRGGLQLATDQMPQGDMLTIPLTSNIGYQNQSHVIVHFTNADPDLGRKGFQPELREVAEEISVALVNHLKRWRSNLKADTGAAPSITSQTDLHEWVRKQEDHEKNAPLTIVNPSFFIPMHQVSIASEPLSEQDVIVLFNQLIAGGVIRGIRLLATSQHEKYDSLFRCFINEPLANHLFDKQSNPLGLLELDHPPFASSPFVLEYKYDLDALIQEFETEEKHEKDVNLVVVWTMGIQWKKRYTVTSLLNLDNLQHRPFHGLTHIVLGDAAGTDRFYAICLSELVQYLNGVDAVQQYHKSQYGDDA